MALKPRHARGRAAGAEEVPANSAPIFLPQTAALVDVRSGLVTRAWWPWFQQVVDTLVALVNTGGGGGGAPDPHHVTHEPGGSDPLAVDAAPGTGSLRTLGTGANQAAPGNDARFTAPSTPTAHAPTHQLGGSDAIRLDDLAAPDDNTDLNATILRHGLLPKLDNVPTHFLDGTGGFSTPVVGVPGPHHASHEPGGSDGLVNAAWRHIDNNFVAQTLASHSAISGPNGLLALRDTNAGVDQKVWRLLQYDDGLLKVEALNDAGLAIQAVPLTIYREGSVAVQGNLSAGGSGGNVAVKSQANTFTTTQTISGSTFAELDLYDSAVPWTLRLLNFDQKFNVYDAGTHLFSVTRSGHAVASGSYYERNRTTPLGHWIDVPFNAANFFAAGATWTVGDGNVKLNRYTLIGKTLFWAIVIEAAPLSAPTNHYIINLPGGLTTTGGYINPSGPSSITHGNGGLQTGVYTVAWGTTAISFYSGTGFVAGGGMYLRAVITIEVL